MFRKNSDLGRNVVDRMQLDDVGMFERFLEQSICKQKSQLCFLFERKFFDVDENVVFDM